jgi:hypothetical protein
MIIKKADIKIVIYLLIIGIIIFLAHIVILRAFPALNVPDVIYIHPFMLILTIITTLVLNIILKKAKPNMMGYAFLGSSLVKMMIAILFLFPVLKGEEEYKKIYVVQFFQIYSMYLAMEVIYLVTTIKNSKKID